MYSTFGNYLPQFRRFLSLAQCKVLLDFVVHTTPRLVLRHFCQLLQAKQKTKDENCIDEHLTNKYSPANT